MQHGLNRNCFHINNTVRSSYYQICKIYKHHLLEYIEPCSTCVRVCESMCVNVCIQQVFLVLVFATESTMRKARLAIPICEHEPSREICSLETGLLIVNLNFTIPFEEIPAQILAKFTYCYENIIVYMF